MTDNEIIMALEICTNGECLKGCPYAKVEGCMEQNGADAVSLINRQKAEIERLQADLTRACAERDARICTADFFKAEAIKEFTERLKRVVAVHNGDMWSKYEYIDNLVKEMVGDDK